MVRYHSKLFDTANPSDSRLHDVLPEVPCSITQAFNESLLKPYLKEEIHTALLQAGWYACYLVPKVLAYSWK